MFCVRDTSYFCCYTTGIGITSKKRLENQQLRETKAEIIDENSFKEYLEEQTVYFLGDGAEKCKNIITHPNAIYINDALPSAKEMALLSYHKWEKKDFEDIAYFEPYYLKDFVATKSKS